MRSSASLLLLAACGGASLPASSQAPLSDAPPLLAASAEAPPPPEATAGDGPRGTAGAGVQTYDRVGYATWYGDLEGEATIASGAAFDPDAIAAAHRTLPLGSIAEITALATGKTILVRITDRGPHDARYEIDLTRGAAGLLGSKDGATPVRVRAVGATAVDASALARGEAAAPRMDAPPALLAALRRQLAALPTAPRAAGAVVRPAMPPVHSATRSAAAPPSPRAPARPAAPAPTASGGYVVQVAAFSTADRAQTLARALGGSVQPAGALFRVRLGPYRDVTTAKRARDVAARRGYADAQIIPAS